MSVCRFRSLYIILYSMGYARPQVSCESHLNVGNRQRPSGIGLSFADLAKLPISRRSSKIKSFGNRISSPFLATLFRGMSCPYDFIMESERGIGNESPCLVSVSLGFALGNNLLAFVRAV